MERTDKIPITYCCPRSPLVSAADALPFPFSGSPHFGYWVNHMQPHPEHALLWVVFKIQFWEEVEKKKRRKERKRSQGDVGTWCHHAAGMRWGGEQRAAAHTLIPEFIVLQRETAPPIPPGWPSIRIAFLCRHYTFGSAPLHTAPALHCIEPCFPVSCPFLPPSRSPLFSPLPCPSPAG